MVKPGVEIAPAALLLGQRVDGFVLIHLRLLQQAILVCQPPLAFAHGAFEVAALIDRKRAQLAGETVSGPLAHLVVRNWGALIALIGGMLIYGAFNPLQPSVVLIVAGASKVIFIALVLSEGTRYLSYQAGVAVAVDSVMVILFVWYLIAARRVAAHAVNEPART